MAFDIKTARPIKGFDISTARPIGTPQNPEVIPPKKAGLPLKQFAMAGLPGFSMSPGSEDVLPAVGQAVGGKYGLLATAGAATGELARQGIKTLRGDASGIERPLELGLGSIGLPRAIPSVGREAASTATIEGLFRGVPRVLFPKQFGGKAREAVGKKLGQTLEAVKQKAPFARVAKLPIIQEAETILKETPFERGPARQAIGEKI